MEVSTDLEGSSGELSSLQGRTGSKEDRTPPPCPHVPVEVPSLLAFSQIPVLELPFLQAPLPRPHLEPFTSWLPCRESQKEKIRN